MATTANNIAAILSLILGLVSLFCTSFCLAPYLWQVLRKSLRTQSKIHLGLSPLSLKANNMPRSLQTLFDSPWHHPVQSHCASGKVDHLLTAALDHVSLQVLLIVIFLFLLHQQGPTSFDIFSREALLFVFAFALALRILLPLVPIAKCTRRFKNATNVPYWHVFFAIAGALATAGTGAAISSQSQRAAATFLLIIYSITTGAVTVLALWVTHRPRFSSLHSSGACSSALRTNIHGEKNSTIPTAGTRPSSSDPYHCIEATPVIRSEFGAYCDNPSHTTGSYIVQNIDATGNASPILATAASDKSCTTIMLQCNRTSTFANYICSPSQQRHESRRNAKRFSTQNEMLQGRSERDWHQDEMMNEPSAKGSMTFLSRPPSFATSLRWKVLMEWLTLVSIQKY